MSERLGYRIEPFGTNRQMVAANSAVARESSTIHLVTEVDITRPREILAEHRASTGEVLSLTAYVATCVARALDDFPELNSFRKGRRLIVLEDVTISVAFEREVDGESVPEPVAIQAINKKTYREVNAELRAAQRRTDEPIGSAMGTAWTRFVPGFLFRTMTRLAYREVGVWMQYGVVGVTAVGMFGSGPMWLVPLSSSTITVAVGSIAKRPALVDGALLEREHLCLTFSFNHDIVDGAPAARLVGRFSEILSSGDELRNLTP
ncbi:MAG TPA: 2-oxo acid dehydrogenase subunit E2 [Coriobacteriia bacterium]|nr:2-oxo acid dehydrogenase subunit E2 [Coriobacteriia bacterium]